MPNVYYDPEAFGLRTLASLEYSDENYCFDTLVVWTDDQENLYSARDSGCSCPTPFEDYNSVAELTRVTLKSIEEEVMSSIAEGNADFIRDRREFLSAIKNGIGFSDNPCADCGRPAAKGDYLCTPCREA